MYALHTRQHWICPLSFFCSSVCHMVLLMQNFVTKLWYHFFSWHTRCRSVAYEHTFFHLLNINHTSHAVTTCPLWDTPCGWVPGPCFSVDKEEGLLSILALALCTQISLGSGKWLIGYREKMYKHFLSKWQISCSVILQLLGYGDRKLLSADFSASVCLYPNNEEGIYLKLQLLWLMTKATAFMISNCRYNWRYRIYLRVWTSYVSAIVEVWCDLSTVTQLCSVPYLTYQYLSNTLRPQLA
jgi:hypothetical protein